MSEQNTPVHIDPEYLDLGRFAMKRIIELDGTGEPGAASIIAVFGALTHAVGAVEPDPTVVDAIGLAFDGKPKPVILSSLMSLLMDFVFVRGAAPS